jgi:CHAT domain-containing protein
MEGKLVLDDQFTLAAMKSQLTHGGKYSIVHIASHFVEQAGNGREPYLMLGGDTAGSTAGFELTLSSLQNSPMRFNGIKLLTLSACSTAKGDAAQNGMEMDSLGMTVQHKGAEAVLATLWDVNDASTSRLMSEFYTQWVNAPSDGKAEALRKIQMEFLHGTSAPKTTVATTKRSLISDDDNAKPVNTAFVGYSHPYYWAPFVLIGNYR